METLIYVLMCFVALFCLFAMLVTIREMILDNTIRRQQMMSNMQAQTPAVALAAPAEPAAPAVTEEAPAPAVATGKAILFSRVTCPNCRVAENLLAKAGVAYEKRIADENLDLCKAYGIKGAPTLVIVNGENHVNYYSVPEIKKYLANI